jgi:hypothetical protein
LSSPNTPPSEFNTENCSVSLVPGAIELSYLKALGTPATSAANGHGRYKITVANPVFQIAVVGASVRVTSVGLTYAAMVVWNSAPCTKYTGGMSASTGPPPTMAIGMPTSSAVNVIDGRGLYTVPNATLSSVVLPARARPVAQIPR